MDLVKDGLFDREYYYELKNGDVSYYKYIWSSAINKYVPFDNFTFTPQIDIQEFEELKRQQGFRSINEVMESGTLRQ